VFNALMTMHPMFGVDLHDGIPPPGPVVVPNMPHFVAAMMKWALPTSKPTPTVLGPLGPLMKQGTDIGNFIPHIAVDYLALMFTAGSGSKSEFGASTVLSEGDPTAAALLLVLNLNLNCCGPTCAPLPSGFVIAPNTVSVGMTLGDILGGLLAGATDCLIQFGLNRFFASNMMSKFFVRLQGPLTRLLIPNAPRFTSLVTAFFGQSSRILSNPVIANTLGNILPALAQTFFVGSPLGYSPDHAPANWAAGEVNAGAQSIGHTVGNAISNLFNHPATPEYPSPAPAGGVAPPPGPAPIPVTP
jgi:hypothetical protein